MELERPEASDLAWFQNPRDSLPNCESGVRGCYFQQNAPRSAAARRDKGRRGCGSRRGCRDDGDPSACTVAERRGLQDRSGSPSLSPTFLRELKRSHTPARADSFGGRPDAACDAAREDERGIGSAGLSVFRSGRKIGVRTSGPLTCSRMLFQMFRRPNVVRVSVSVL